MKSEGGVKFTDHHITSPLANMNNTYQVCHRESEAVLAQNVYERQDMVINLRNHLEKQLVKTHLKAKFLWDNGANATEMKPVLDYIRKAQWRWDYIAASPRSCFTPLWNLREFWQMGMFNAMEADNTMNLLSIEKTF